MLPGFTPPSSKAAPFVESGGFETDQYRYSNPGEPDGGPYFDGRWFAMDSGVARTNTALTGTYSLLCGNTTDGGGAYIGNMAIRFPAALIKGRRMQLSVDAYARDNNSGVFLQWSTLAPGADRSTKSEIARDYMQNYGWLPNQWKRYVMPCPATAGSDPSKDVLLYFSYYNQYTQMNLDNWEFRTL